MEITVSKWGNSLGLRIPTKVIETMNVKVGDKLNYEVKDEEIIIKKKNLVEQEYEKYFGKPYSEITEEEIFNIPCEIVDWGEDVGGEIIK